MKPTFTSMMNALKYVTNGLAAEEASSRAVDQYTPMTTVDFSQLSQIAGGADVDPAPKGSWATSGPQL